MEINKIPIAEEFLDFDIPNNIDEKAINSAIEFARLHVKIALDKIYEESKHGDQEHQDWLKAKFDSYNLDIIK